MSGSVSYKEGGRVTGLTTASTIWLTAALGMGIGAGQYVLTGFVVLVSLVVLWMFPKLEQGIDNVREERLYEVVSVLNPSKASVVEALFQQCALKIRPYRQVKERNNMIYSWRARGSHPAHEKLVKALFDDPEVQEFHF